MNLIYKDILSSYIEFCSFSHDGQYLACCCYDEIYVFDVTEFSLPKLVTNLQHVHATWQCVFHPYHPFLLSVNSDGHLYQWKLFSGELDSKVFINDTCLFTLDVHHKKNVIAVGGFDGMITILDLQTMDKIHVLKEHTDSVEDLSFCQQSNILASASKDVTIRIWYNWYTSNNHKKRVKCRILGRHEHWVFCVRFSKDGKILISSSADKTIGIWNMTDKKLIRSLVGHTNIVWRLSFATLSTGDEAVISVSSDRSLRVWDLENPQRLFHSCNLDQESGGDNQLLALSVCPDKDIVAVGTFYGTLLLLHLPSENDFKKFDPVQNIQQEESFKEIRGGIIEEGESEEYLEKMTFILPDEQDFLYHKMDKKQKTTKKKANKGLINEGVVPGILVQDSNGTTIFETQPSALRGESQIECELLRTQKSIRGKKSKSRPSPSHQSFGKIETDSAARLKEMFGECIVQQSSSGSSCDEDDMCMYKIDESEEQGELVQQITSIVSLHVASCEKIDDNS